MSIRASAPLTVWCLPRRAVGDAVSTDKATLAVVSDVIKSVLLWVEDGAWQDEEEGLTWEQRVCAGFEGALRVGHRVFLDTDGLQQEDDSE